MDKSHVKNQHHQIILAINLIVFKFYGLSIIGFS